MSAGYYKRRRGIVEHIEAGSIDLLESGIHDYLLLKANLVIGNKFPIPAGVCLTSAPAISAHCQRVSERTIQRCLEHLEALDFIKTWKVPGKRGNYPVLVCRGSVHDLSGNEYRVNGSKTTDWRNPFYEPVGEVSGKCRHFVGEVSGYREVRELENREKRERQHRAAKPAPPADSRFHPFLDFAYKAFEAKHGSKPSWLGKDFSQLRQLLKANTSLSTKDLESRWVAYLDSSEAFISKQGDALGYFASHCDVFSNGPISQTKGKANGNDINAAIETTVRGFIANAQVRH